MQLATLRLGLNDDQRYQLEAVLQVLDEATSEFEKLVGMKDRAELLEGLNSLNQHAARGILLACVLNEQQRRADLFRSAPPTTPPAGKSPRNQRDKP